MVLFFFSAVSQITTVDFNGQVTTVANGAFGAISGVNSCVFSGKFKKKKERKKERERERKKEREKKGRNEFKTKKLKLRKWWWK